MQYKWPVEGWYCHTPYDQIITYCPKVEIMISKHSFHQICQCLCMEIIVSFLTRTIERWIHGFSGPTSCLSAEFKKFKAEPVLFKPRHPCRNCISFCICQTGKNTWSKTYYYIKLGSSGYCGGKPKFCLPWFLGFGFWNVWCWLNLATQGAIIHQLVQQICLLFWNKISYMYVSPKGFI